MARGRNRYRFSRLAQRLRDAKSVTPADTEIQGYLQWLTGQKKLTISAAAKTRLEGEKIRFGYSILPFNVDPGATPTGSDRIQVPITQWSERGLRLLTITKGHLGLEATGDAQRNAGFYPATLRVFVPSASIPVSPISQITGKEYKRLPGTNYSFPFGRTITGGVAAKGAPAAAVEEADEEAVRASATAHILEKATALGGAAVKTSVSYVPEFFSSSGKKLPDVPANLPA